MPSAAYSYGDHLRMENNGIEMFGSDSISINDDGGSCVGMLERAKTVSTAVTTTTTTTANTK